MVMRTYHIRAEYPESKHEDFTVKAEELPTARDRAEEFIRISPFNTADYPRIEWRGQVAFVDRQP